MSESSGTKPSLPPSVEQDMSSNSPFLTETNTETVPPKKGLSSLSLPKRILCYVFFAILAFVVVVSALHVSVFLRILASTAYILTGYTFLCALQSLLLAFPETLPRIVPSWFLVLLLGPGPYPNPQYTHNFGDFDTTQQSNLRTYILISSLGIAIEYAFVFVFVAIPFVAFKIRQKFKLVELKERSSQDEEHNTGTEAETPGMGSSQASEPKPEVAKKGWWTKAGIVQKAVDCACNLMIAPLGVAALRSWRAEPVWDPVEGVDGGVDDVSYRQAFTAIVVGAFCCGLIQVMWKKLRHLRLFVGGKQNADSSSTHGFVDLSTGRSEKEALGDKA